MPYQVPSIYEYDALVEQLSLLQKKVEELGAKNVSNENLTKRVTDLEARIAEMSQTDPVLPPSNPPKPPSNGSASIVAPDRFSVPGILRVRVINAAGASAWLENSRGQGKVMPLQKPLNDGLVVFAVNEPGRIVISADPGTDRQVDQVVILEASSVEPTPPVGGEILVKPTDSLAEIFDGLPENQTVSLPLGAVFDEALPTPPNGTTINVYGQGDRPIVRGMVAERVSRSDVTIEGLHFTESKEKDGAVFFILNQWSDLTLRDNIFEGGTRGIVIQGIDDGHRDILIVNNIIKGQRTDDSVEPRGIGIFIWKTHNARVIGNLFENIGYDDRRTWYSQAVYASTGTAGTVLKGNVFNRIGAAAFQLREGGEARNNIILRQSIHSWITGEGSVIEGCLAAFSEDIKLNPVNGFLPSGGGFQINKGGEGSRLIGNQVYHDRGTNTRFGAYKFEVNPTKVEVRGNLAGDFDPIAERQGTPVNLDGIREVTPPDVSGLEAWADSLASRPYGEPMPDVAAKIAGYYDAARGMSQ